jgi:hypothetical protein
MEFHHQDNLESNSRNSNSTNSINSASSTWSAFLRTQQVFEHHDVQEDAHEFEA